MVTFPLGGSYVDLLHSRVAVEVINAVTCGKRGEHGAIMRDIEGLYLLTVPSAPSFAELGPTTRFLPRRSSSCAAKPSTRLRLPVRTSMTSTDAVLPAGTQTVLVRGSNSR
jgi:hypothetical protein